MHPEKKIDLNIFIKYFFMFLKLFPNTCVGSIGKAGPGFKRMRHFPVLAFSIIQRIKFKIKNFTYTWLRAIIIDIQ